MLIYEMARSSIRVEDSNKVSRLGTCPAKIPTPTELTLVLFRFKNLKLAPMNAIISTESSSTEVPLRSRCAIAFILGKNPNLLIEELDTSKKYRKLVLTCKRVWEISMNEAPAIISFERQALLPSPSNKECMVQLLMFRKVREGKFGTFVTLVQARFRKVNLENLRRIAAPLLDISLPQRSRYRNFLRTYKCYKVWQFIRDVLDSYLFLENCAKFYIFQLRGCLIALIYQWIKCHATTCFSIIFSFYKAQTNPGNSTKMP